MGSKYYLNSSTSNESYEIIRSLPSGNSDRFHLLPNEKSNRDDATHWTKPFYFIQAADTQFGLIDNYIKKLDKITWDEEMALSENLVNACNRMEPKPRFLVVCGDLTDAWPGTEMKREQVFDFKRIFSKLDPSIPMVCVCGNHDIGNEPTFDSLNEYRRDFGDDFFYFATGGVLFIVLNSQFYQHRANLEQYAQQQDEWLDKILKRCKAFKYSIVFEHIPWFLKQPDEEDEYFNVHKELRLSWLRKFREAGVDKIMCGHYHRNAGGFYEDIELIVTSAVGGQLGDDKSGVRIVKLLDDKIEHRYFPLDDLPASITL